MPRFSIDFSVAFFGVVLDVVGNCRRIQLIWPLQWHTILKIL